MGLGVLVVVLAAALLHASWNLLIKSRPNTDLATATIYIGAGLLAAAALPWLPGPARASWPYLAASTLVEFIYGVLLAAAYRVGDFSHAYPLMRGTAPLLVAIGSITLIGERLSVPLAVGVVLVSSGILSMIFDARSQRHSTRATQLALLNALVIAVYTTIDGVGVRLSGQPVAYGLWLFALIGIPWIVWSAARWRAHGSVPWRGQITIGLVGGACSLTSYAVALWAMTRAPVAAVAAVRETSILFGTVLGAVVLHERVSRARALAALAIAAGVLVIRGS
jgi:drug/metabolite transporter (DMT)-like permease